MLGTLDNKSVERLTAALQSGDPIKFEDAFKAYNEDLKQAIRRDYNANYNEEVLAQRGYRRLTVEEKKFYEGFAKCVKDPNPKQAIANFTYAMPQTIIDSVMDELAEEHPLLDAVNFVNAEYLTKWIMDAHDTTQLAVWGAITSQITQEITGSLKEIDLTQNKLSAFFYLSEDLVDLGPAYFDAYVRQVLQNAVFGAFEQAVVTGNGLVTPIGMDRQVQAGVTVSTTTGYPQKSAVALADWGEDYLAKVGALAIAENGKVRNVTEVILVVNASDYFTKVLPKISFRALSGEFTQYLPFKTRIIPSRFVTANSAILGIGKKYTLAVAMGKNGKIEYSDEYKFLEDNRTYKMKLFANGRAYDNTCFTLLNITNTKKAGFPVEVINVVTTQEAQ